MDEIGGEVERGWAEAGGERFLTPRRIALWLVAPAVVVLSGTVGLIGEPAGPGQWVLLAVAGALAGIPAVVQGRREYDRAREAASAEEIALDYEARLAVTLGDAVTPIAHLLGRMAEAGSAERALLRGQLLQRVVDATAELVGEERTRAAYFSLEGGAMSCAAWGGRGDAPTATFSKGTPAGDIAHEVVRRRGHLYVADVQDAPEGLEIDPEVGYRSFISVAVYAGARDLGMLTVDGVEAEAVSEQDLDVVRALAQLLGVGLAMAASGAGPVTSRTAR